MLTKEFGFSLVLSEIFGFENNSESDLDKSKYLNGNIQNLSITEDGYIAIKKYTDDANSKIGLEIINGILATFAYKIPDPVNKLGDSIKKTILRQKDSLFKELEEFLPNLAISLNHQEYQVCMSLMRMQTSYNLIDCLANQHFSFGIERIFKNSNFFGLQSLLPTIAGTCSKEFEKWYFKTERNDLKAVFINSFLGFHFDSISKFPEDDFIESKIDVLRLSSILAKIGADRWGGGITREKAKSLIPEKKIAEKEKLRLILYSFKYSRFDPKEDVENKLLEDDIKIFSNNFTYLDEEMILEFLEHVDDLVLAKIIGSIEDREARIKLFSVIVSRLDSRLIGNRRPHIQDILKANLHGLLLKEFGDKYEQKVEGLFSQSLGKIDEPYFYYRHNDLWSEAISRAMYYLIMIFILYHDKDSSKVSFYKNEFLSAKRSFYHYLSKQFDEMLDQIK